MKHVISTIAAVGLITFIVRWLVGIFPRGTALRPVTCTSTDRVPDPHEGQPNSERWYVESTERFNVHSTVPPEGLPYSCSFVEFDERGDYLDFHQHRHAYQKIEDLTKAKEPLFLVIFVHGWRNNCQSGNVTSFNYFLSQLADLQNKGSTNPPKRVHGLYLAWRGANFRHDLDEHDEHYKKTTGHFGKNPLVDLGKYTARVKWLAVLIETLTYHNRKSVPEHKFAGTSLSRTILTCAHIAKQAPDNPEGAGVVMLMGHSFGALLLERTLQNAVMAELIEAWPAHARGPAQPAEGATVAVANAPGKRTEPGAKPKANPLPFDTVLLVNSAAPSIYARQFQSFLAAHREAMSNKPKGGGDAHREAKSDEDKDRGGAPIFISITSEADWATGKTHPAGNCLASLSPTLRRDYRADDFILDVAAGTAEPWIPLAYYYKHTPGHNPLLVNRFIEPFKLNNTSPPANTFHTDSSDKSATQDWWIVNMPPEKPANKDWSRYEAHRPVAWNEKWRETAYWIVRCPKEIISGHNDIWNSAAMDMYKGFHRIATKDQKENAQTRGT